MAPRIAFVTVGTTKFDALIEAVDDHAFADELAAQSFTTLVVQFFKYAPNLDVHMRNADLIISHAGAGSLFEALRMGKPLIAVPNAILMHNHQAELAAQLQAMGHCFTATPENLLDVMQQFEPSRLVPYKVGDATGIVQTIEAHMQKSK